MSNANEVYKLRMQAATTYGAAVIVFFLGVILCFFAWGKPFNGWTMLLILCWCRAFVLQRKAEEYRERADFLEQL